MALKTLITVLLALGMFTVNAQKQVKKKDSEKYGWEAGLAIGSIKVAGDVTAIPGLNAGFWISKPLTSWFSINIKYETGTAKGLNWQPATNYQKNEAWADKYAALVRDDNSGVLTSGYVRNGKIEETDFVDKVYYNYKTSISGFSIYPKFTLWFPFSNPFIGVHLMGGVNLIQYKVKVDALNGEGDTYAELFNQIASSTTLPAKGEIITQLKSGIDGVYETNAESTKKPDRIANVIGIGASVRIKEKFVAGFEASYSAVKSDLLDGQQWQEFALGDAVLTRDFDHITNLTLSIGYRF